MPAVKVKLSQFSALSKVHTRDNDGLAAIIRGLAIDNARVVMQTAGVADLTDNTTGVAASTYAAMPIPSTAADVTSSGGAQTAALNTSLGKTANAMQVLKNSLNNARARLGLGMVVFNYGTQASANTLPAQDKTGTAANGATAAKLTTTAAAFTVARDNFLRLAFAANEIFVAMGEARLALPSVSYDLGLTLTEIPTVTSVAAGPGGVAIADVDAFLDAMADNLATLAYRWNSVMMQAAYVASITDNSGGTPAAGLVANAAPAAADGAATTSAPKAGFDTQLGVIENAISELATPLNTLLRMHGITPLTNNTGEAANGTIEALSVNLTAVDGSTGTDAVDVVTATARMGTVNNALKSIAAKLNALAPLYGVDPLTDALVGTVSNTLANIAATGTGVSGVGATMLDTAVDTWLTNNRNNIATLAAKLNSMLGTSSVGRALNVIAG